MSVFRNYIVQTEEQYIFIYEAINEALQSGPTEILARNLFGQLQRLLQPINDSSLTEMELEFKVKHFHQSERTTPHFFLAVGEHQSSTVEIHQCQSSRE